jgi:DNA-binding NtrC family response regulator
MTCPRRRGQGIAMSAAAGVSVSQPAVSAVVSPAAESRFVDSPILPLNEMERRAIVHALEYTKGDRLMAAGLLGIGRTTLYRKLKEYQMPV